MINRAIGGCSNSSVCVSGLYKYIFSDCRASLRNILRILRHVGNMADGRTGLKPIAISINDSNAIISSQP